MAEAAGKDPDQKAHYGRLSFIALKRAQLRRQFIFAIATFLMTLPTLSSGMRCKGSWILNIPGGMANPINSRCTGIE